MNQNSLKTAFGRFIFNNPWKIIGVFVLISLGALFFAKDLRISADLKALLPTEFDSVQGLKELQRKHGGNRYLVLGLELKDAEDAPHAHRFLADFHKQAEQLPQIKYIITKKPSPFFLKRFPLYLQQETLQKIDRYVTNKVANLKGGASPVFDDLFFSLEDDANLYDLVKEDISENPVSLQFSEYYQNEEGTLFAALIKPEISGQNLNTSRQFLETIKALVQGLKPESYGQGIRISYAGGYQKVLGQETSLREDFARVSVIVSVLLFLALLLYYRRLSSLVLIGLPLAFGILWTLAVIVLQLGQVNIITTFSAAILAGLGSDYGIYLLSRYYEERSLGRDVKKAFTETFAHTSQATRASVLSTMVAFGALYLSQMRGFSEFGFIGFVGTLFNFIAFHTVFPALLVLMAKHKSSVLMIPGRWRFPKPVALTITIAMVSVTVLLAAGLPKISYIEYDLQKMEDRTLASATEDKKFNSLLGKSYHPAFLIVPQNDKLEREIHPKVEDLIESYKDDSMIYTSVSLTSFVPANQDDLRPLIRKIQKKLSTPGLKFAGPSQKVRELFLESDINQTITTQSLPQALKRHFEIPESDERLVYLLAKHPRDDTSQIKRFAYQIRDVAALFKNAYQSVSDFYVITDIIDLIEDETPKIIGGVWILCFFILILEFKSLSAAGLLMVVLTLTMTLFGGLFSLFDFRFNLYNLSVAPIIIGVGLDSFIHFYYRYKEDPEHIGEAVRNMVPSISMANLTTIIGIGTLIISRVENIRSAGWMAVLGVLSVTLVSLTLFPALLVLSQGRLRSASHDLRKTKDNKSST